MIHRPPRSTLFPYTSSSDLALLQSPLTDSNRRPPPYHVLPDATGGSRWQRFGASSSHSQASGDPILDRKSTRLNSSHTVISYAVFCLKKKKQTHHDTQSHNV